jgi:hypothetical protein
MGTTKAERRWKVANPSETRSTEAAFFRQERGPRILNPVKQGHDLDPTEAYVRRWLPELMTVPPGFAHEPWNWLDNPLGALIVDHKAAFRAARAWWGNQKQALLPREDVLLTHF